MTFSTNLKFPLEYQFEIPPIVTRVIPKKVDHRSVLIIENNQLMIKLNQRNNFNGTETIGIKSKHQDMFGLNYNQSNLEFKFEFNWNIDVNETKNLNCYGTPLGCPMIDQDQMKKTKEIKSIDLELPNLCRSGRCQCEIKPSIDAISQKFEYIVGGENPFVFTIHLMNLGTEPGFGIRLELFSDEDFGIPVGYNKTKWEVQKVRNSNDQRGDLNSCDKNCNDVRSTTYFILKIE